MFEKYAEQMLAAIDLQSIMAGFGRIAVIILLWWVFTRLSKKLLAVLQRKLLKSHTDANEPASEEHKRITTLIMLVRQGILILITATTILLGLKQLGIDIAPILASAGIVGLAVGFGAQNLVRDIISGFFLILENKVRVGDVATINGTTGLVEECNFRTLIVRDLTGTKHIWPNGEIKTISNLTSEWSAFVFDIGVHYNSDIDKVIRVMHEEGKKLREDPAFSYLIIEDFEVFGVDKFVESAMIIKGRVKTRPIQQWVVGREYQKRLKQRFDKENITIPFPQRDLYLKTMPEFMKHLETDQNSKGQEYASDASKQTEY